MLNIGLTELILLALIAALFVGPDKLPEMARWIGKMLRKARLLLDDLQSELQQDADLREVQQVGKELKSEMQELKTQFQEAARDVTDAVDEGKAVLRPRRDDLGDDEEEILRRSKFARPEAEDEPPPETDQDRNGDVAAHASSPEGVVPAEVAEVTSTKPGESAGS